MTIEVPNIAVLPLLGTGNVVCPLLESVLSTPMQSGNNKPELITSHKIYDCCMKKHWNDSQWNEIK